MKFRILTGTLLLSACGEAVPPPRSASHVPVPSNVPAMPASTPVSVAAIRGQTAQHLIAQFGTPMLDISEGTARKLQFGGPICVLDTYLYPPAKGKGDQVVTYLDTRQRNGAPIDPASCVAALTKRK